MQNFKSYCLQEFANTNYAASDFKFTHSINAKVDKKTEMVLTENIINVSVKIFDGDMNELNKKTFKFVNNIIQPALKKKLINIAPAELENRFMAALPQIASIIKSSYEDKINVLTHQVQDLNHYVSHNNIVIPNQFVGERVMIADDSVMNESVKEKKNFEF